LKISRQQRRDWEQSKIADNSGDIGRLVPSGQIVVPSDVSVVGDKLHWSYGPPGVKFVTPDRKMLGRFAQLWDQPAASIERFAKQWGLLHLEHPKTLSSGEERIADWRFYSQQAAMIVRLIIAINAGQGGSMQDWKELGLERVQGGAESLFEGLPPATRRRLDQRRCELYEWRPKLPPHKPEIPIIAPLGTESLSVETGGELIAFLIQMWLNLWHVPPGRYRFAGIALSDFSIEYASGRWKLGINHQYTLLPAIGFQLALTAVNGNGLYCCSGCGRAYIRDSRIRAPKTGGSNYCEECGQEQAGAKRSMKRLREKRRRARLLQRAGHSAAAIAKELGTDEEKVKKWLGNGD